MSRDTLFGDLPEAEAVAREWPGSPRLREPVRDQVELRAVDLKALLPAEHPARVIWAYVQRLDLRGLEETVRARAHGPGQAPVSPRLQLALWLFATSQGVGSARALARLCESHDAYRWLCGGVSVNYHSLSEFRTAHPQLLEQLLVEHVASLSVAGVIELDEVVQDGVRVRASAGASSFRRSKKLHKELKKAKRLVEHLRQENDDDPDASNRRIRAAEDRAAREREARVAAALEQLAAIEAHRARRGRENRNNRKKGSKRSEPRASTTDPQARVMKMADGGFRPAYNCQVASVAEGQIAIAVDVTNVGSDRGLMRPMQERLAGLYGHAKRYLVDGGFNKNEDIEWAASQGIKVYGPPANSKHETDPYAPRPEDGSGMAAWRRRMKSPHGKRVYKRRAPGECINARFRNWGLRQFTVRGREKVLTVLRWFALANNVLAGHRLLAPAA
ncbi:IS1182 family transposase [Bradyrhizobium sp. Arg68]|uniref:IS1182 family transposase n=1 Tax=Bradyrhizobium ivorense TaxID=2511166 RepID=UPI001E630639|nr:IS1182 family transposase [Bradyrhizobium ivorense]MCC8939503.1 IS1182 family transposase [Bradyrhizobium ivorense]